LRKIVAIPTFEKLGFKVEVAFHICVGITVLAAAHAVDKRCRAMNYEDMKAQFSEPNDSRSNTNSSGGARGGGRTSGVFGKLLFVVLPFTFAALGGMWYFQKNSAAANFSFGDLVNPSWWVANGYASSEAEADDSAITENEKIGRKEADDQPKSTSRNPKDVNDRSVIVESIEATEAD